MKRTVALIVAMLFAGFCIEALPAVAQVIAAPSVMNFQGRLAKPDGTPVADGVYALRFRLYDALTGGNVKFEQTVSSVTVRNGTFAVALSGFASGTFNGNLWLGIKVGTEAELTPRQPLASVAYAMKANSVPDGSIGTAQIANGSITAAKFAPNLLNPLAWLLNGNSGVTSGFLGTTDDKPLELRVNNRRAMRYQYAENTSIIGFEYRSVNVLGGSEINSIGAGVVGATIAGGGRDLFTSTDRPNRVLADFGTVGGGYQNTASGFAATVGGGYLNKVSGLYSTVGGGYFNTASGFAATVGGGYLNTASDLYSTVGGGNLNTAAGAYSFAAGCQAKANHDGAFVWGDSTLADFASTAPNQFLIRASGGVGINTNAPVGTLHIKGLQGALNLEGTTNHVYMQFFPRGVAAGRKAYIGFASAGTHDITIANEDGGAVRVVGTFVNNSDVRYKTNIAPLDNALDNILNLRGVSYDWRKDMPGQHFTQQHQIGFIAQEVEKVLPELVYTDSGGYKSVAYVNVVPVLVEAVKTLKTQLDDKQKQIDALQRQQAEIADVKAQLAALTAALKAGERPR